MAREERAAGRPDAGGRRATSRRAGSAAGLVMGLAVGLALTACRGDSAAEAPPPSSTAAPSTSEPPVDPNALRTATGALGAPRDERIGPPGSGRAADGTLGPGTCFDEVLVETAEGELDHQVLIVDCAGPHDAEVYSTATMEGPAGGAYVGDAAAARFATTTCLDRFEPFVGREYATSQLRIAIMRPTQSSWAAGDRLVVCSVYDRELVPLQRSMAGSGR